MSQEKQDVQVEWLVKHVFEVIGVVLGIAISFVPDFRHSLHRFGEWTIMDAVLGGLAFGGFGLFADSIRNKKKK